MSCSRKAVLFVCALAVPIPRISSRSKVAAIDGPLGNVVLHRSLTQVLNEVETMQLCPQ